MYSMILLNYVVVNISGNNEPLWYLDYEYRAH